MTVLGIKVLLGDFDEGGREEGGREREGERERGGKREKKEERGRGPHFRSMSLRSG